MAEGDGGPARGRERSRPPPGGELGLAAVICFHRGEAALLRRHLENDIPYAERMGNRVIAPLALARSLDSEHDGAVPAALAALTAGVSDNMEELEEVEDLLADAVRLAMQHGRPGHGARPSTGHAAALKHADSRIPQPAGRRDLLPRPARPRRPGRLAEAAERFGEASRPLLHAQALEAAAGFRRDYNKTATGPYARFGVAKIFPKVSVCRRRASGMTFRIASIVMAIARHWQQEVAGNLARQRGPDAKTHKGRLDGGCHRFVMGVKVFTQGYRRASRPPNAARRSAKSGARMDVQDGPLRG